MNKQTTRIALALALAGISLPAVAQDAALAATEKPKLILQITVDQLRGDLPARFLDRMGDGGFRYFLEKGIADSTGQRNTICPRKTLRRIVLCHSSAVPA